MEPTIIGYLSSNLGFIENAAKDNIGIAAGGIGFSAEGKNYVFNAEGGYGTALYAKAEGGVKIPFGESSKFGFKAVAGAQYTQSTKSRDYYKNVFEEGANSPTWKANDTRGYLKAGLTYSTPVFKAEVGAMGGIKSCTQPSLQGTNLAEVGQTRGTEYAGTTSKPIMAGYVHLEAGKRVKATLDISTNRDFGLGVKINLFKK